MTYEFDNICSRHDPVGVCVHRTKWNGAGFQNSCSHTDREKENCFSKNI
jgi:hypothetical protein